MSNRTSALIGTVAVGVILVLAWVLLSFDKTPADKIGIRYGGGPIEGAHFEGIVDPGHSLYLNGFMDRQYLYPVTQRNYIISRRSGEGDVTGEDFVEAPSKDGVAVTFEVATYFKLNTDLLRRFHENIGLKYAAYTEDGWTRMLNDSFRQQIENAIQREARTYSVADLYFNRQVLQDIQNGIGQVLKDNVNNSLGGEYFCGPTFVIGRGNCPDFRFVIKQIRPLDADVVQTFEDVRKSQIAIQTRRNELQQAKLQALAVRKLTQGQKLTPEYVELKAIEAGKVTFWILPSNNPVTVQAPKQP
jgi:regulator of protease activity HflC (stomatin/prohibitin superfamily)